MSKNPVSLESPEPAANPDLLGHEAAEATLLQALGSSRLPHAWLISGPRGIGKATFAYRFARYLLSGGGVGQGANLFGEAPASLRTDPADPVFQQIVAQGHPDLRSLRRGINQKTGRPSKDIVVADVRAVGSFLRRTAAEGGWRIVIVDSIDDANASASNALLKMLEEPPPDALLLLVSHAPGSLLPTIHSRCCRLALGPLPDETVLTLLGRYAPGLSAADATGLVRLAEGSIGRALTLAEGGGLELYRELVEILDGLPRLDVPRVHALADRLARDAEGAAFRTGMELLAWWVARLVRGGAANEAPAEVVAGEGALRERLVGRPPDRRALARWLLLWEKITGLLARSEGINLDRKQVVITALLEFEAAAS